jgi:uncharacterized cofD-like protein
MIGPTLPRAPKSETLTKARGGGKLIGMIRLNDFLKWFTPGIGVKRWFVLLALGVGLLGLGLALLIARLYGPLMPEWREIIAYTFSGIVCFGIAFRQVLVALLKPYRLHQHGRVVDVVYAYSKRQRGLKVVAIGGGTGLPSVLRGMKRYTSNITAVVTVADDGGSSGRLRRDMGVLPPGDLRNNIAALADDESLITQLFQYRFKSGDLSGHSFGNLFISALTAINDNSIEKALAETARVLNIQGRVLPATLTDVNLQAIVRQPNSNRTIRIQGESNIGQLGGTIEAVQLEPADAPAYPDSVQAILDADVVVMGPGSLYTSILPGLLISGIADALRATAAYKIYVCNVATQPGETDDYGVAEHVMAIEQHIGRGVIQAVIANAHMPTENSGVTQYVQRAPDYHPIAQRYQIRYADLVDDERPWRHDPSKLAKAILALCEAERAGVTDVQLLEQN